MTRVTLILLLLGLTGCQAESAPDSANTLTAVEPDLASRSMTRSGAPFVLWKQGFEHGTDGWTTDETPGAPGWCGDIETVERGDAIAPSAGDAHAVVRQGACNEYWRANGFAESGPYSAGAGYSEGWPTGGYVTELDVYLDPDWTAPQPFTLAFSVNLLDQPFGQGFRYFMVPAMVTVGALQVAGHTVVDAGWYTFRFKAGSDAGQLAVSFEMARHGQALARVPLTTTAFSGESASSFPTANVGSGYVWFAGIADGLELAIDEHRVRRGR